jgi:hypothetical protein
MRTTLTLDDDVSVQLDELRQKHGLSFKDAVNDVLRHGLRAMAEGPQTGPMFVTQSLDLGSARVPLDNIAEALAVVERKDVR